MFRWVIARCTKNPIGGAAYESRTGHRHGSDAQVGQLAFGTYLSRFCLSGSSDVKASPTSLRTSPVKESTCGTFGYSPPVVVYPAFASR